MILALFFFCFCGIVTCSPVSEVEERGLVGDIAMGILVGKIQEMLGITTTPKPRPVLDGIAGLFGATTTTAAPPTDEEKLGLLQTLFSLFFPAADTTTTTTTPTTTKCGGLLGGSRESPGGRRDGDPEPSIHSAAQVVRLEAGNTARFPCSVTNLGPLVLIWKHGTRVLTAGVGAGTMYVKKDARISLAGTDLVVANITQEDSGKYTCELDSDDDDPLSVTHTLQILGGLLGCSSNDETTTTTTTAAPATTTTKCGGLLGGGLLGCPSNDETTTTTTTAAPTTTTTKCGGLLGGGLLC